jgi:hypothetical protein
MNRKAKLQRRTSKTGRSDVYMATSVLNSIREIGDIGIASWFQSF